MESVRRPIIGILGFRKKKKNPSFIDQKSLREFIRIGQHIGADMFVFSPDDIIVPHKSLRGYIPGRRNKWISKTFPWPEIVLDRSRYLKPTLSNYISLRDKQLFHFLNHFPDYHHKLDVLNLLQKDIRINKWIPKSMIYTKKHLIEMLSSFNSIYIKPLNSGGGIRILKIKRLQNHFQVWHSHKRRKTITYTSIEDLHLAITRWMKRRRYFIQQGLDLELAPSRMTDLRIFIQKDGTTEWRITGMGMRVGEPQQPTSNLNSGGSAKEPLSILENKFGLEKAQQMLGECKELALASAQIFDEQFGDMIELGIDIGIDTTGNIWFIEANSMPGRKIFKQLNRNDLYQLSIERPIQFAMTKAKEISIT